VKLLWSVALILAAGMAFAQDQPWKASTAASGVKSVPNNPSLAVQYLFPEQVSVVAGKDAVIDLHFKVNDGFHINSHTPREKYLIATQLNVTANPGIKTGSFEFPAGSDYALAAAPDDKLSVYSGEFIVRAHIQAATGQHMFEGKLHYQACDSNSCYPPRDVPVAVDVIAK
jgi:hypothetical protein